MLIGTGIPPGLAGKFRDSGINRLMLVDGPGLEETVELRVQALSEMVREAKPGILLCSTTIFGREMAARLAAALKTGLARQLPLPGFYRRRPAAVHAAGPHQQDQRQDGLPHGASPDNNRRSRHIRHQAGQGSAAAA